jgi:hypothetical protein
LISQDKVGDIDVKVNDSLQCQTAQRIVLKYINGMLTTYFDNLVMAAKHLILHHYVQVDRMDACILNCEKLGAMPSDGVKQPSLRHPTPSLSIIKGVEHSSSETVTYVACGQRQTRCVCVCVCARARARVRVRVRVRACVCV